MLTQNPSPALNHPSVLSSPSNSLNFTENASLEETLYYLNDQLRRLGYMRDEIDLAIALLKANLEYGIDRISKVPSGVPWRDLSIVATINEMDAKYNVMKQVSREILDQSKRYRILIKCLASLSILLVVLLVIVWIG